MEKSNLEVVARLVQMLDSGRMQCRYCIWCRCTELRQRGLVQPDRNLQADEGDGVDGSISIKEIDLFEQSV